MADLKSREEVPTPADPTQPPEPAEGVGQGNQTADEGVDALPADSVGESDEPLHEGEEEESEDEEDGLEWMLGFVESPEGPFSLLRHRFPSKIGGRPAWLNPVDLPAPEQLTCSASGLQLDFLLQVYAPVESVPDAFHRTIFLFVTPEGDKVQEKGAVRAFRSQLPVSNRFYPSEPAGEDDNTPQSLPAEDIATNSDRDPWMVLEAEGRLAESRKPSELGRRMLPEHELVVEPEEGILADADMGAIDEDTKRLMREYKERKETGEALTDAELPDEIVNDVERHHSEDRQRFQAFTARIAPAPEQVLRYCYEEGAEPLWPSAERIPTAADIPCCSNCGSARRFEFQVLPQMIHFLDIDISKDLDKTLDWSTVAVYTCSRSCSPPKGSGYCEEFTWVQPA